MRDGRRGVSAGAFALMVVIVLVVGLGGAATCWAKPVPVRDAVISVDHLRLSAASVGLRSLTGSPLRESTTASTVDAGMVFNLLGAVAMRDASSREAGVDFSVRVRASLDGTTWSEWVTLPLSFSDGEGSEFVANKLVGEPCWVGDARYVQFTASGPMKDLKFVFVNSLGQPTALRRAREAVSDFAAAASSALRPQVADAVTTQPRIVTRAQWGANESLRRCDPEYAPVRMAFVHHTVNGNGYSRSQAPALVRAVYQYHVRGNGWNDIGYNFLIDRFGTIYEGRYGGMTKGPVGGQVLGFNTNSTGIALLGTYTKARPSPQAVVALKRLLAWKLDVHHVDPNSMATMTCRATQKYKEGELVRLRAISGHRDANFTTCPGGAAYAVLSGVRVSAASMGLPKIYAPSALPELFSPNSDGVDDAVTLSFRASEKVSWRIEISDQGGTLVRAFAGSGSRVAKLWDGKNRQGVVVPDGLYTAKITARSARGAVRPASLLIAVDALPPVIESFTASPMMSTRLDNGRRQPVRFVVGASTPSQLRLTISRPGAVLAAQVLNWTSLAKSPRTVVWDGQVSFAGVKIPAPDGAYTATAQVRDGSGFSVQRSLPVTCVSDPAKWGDGSVFVTKLLNSPTLKRGGAASFRYTVVLAPPLGKTPSFSTAKAVAFRVRDAGGIGVLRSPSRIFLSIRRRRSSWRKSRFQRVSTAPTYSRRLRTVPSSRSPSGAASW